MRKKYLNNLPKKFKLARSMQKFIRLKKYIRTVFHIAHIIYFLLDVLSEIGKLTFLRREDFIVSMMRKEGTFIVSVKESFPE